MGANFTAPQSVLNISTFNNATGKIFRTDGLQTLTNEWELYTGPNSAGSTLKGRFFLPPGPLNNFNMEATLGSIQFFAAGGMGTINTPIQRMIITNGDYVNAAGGLLTPNVTRVGISYDAVGGPITTPVSLLHLGFQAAPGQRNWMDIGMFIAKGDNMYVGLKEEANNRQDAVINWGDDGVAAGPDNLRFIFTTNSSGPPPAFGFDGLETGRVTPFGNWGIGNFFNDPLFTFGNPVRKMEILSDKAVAAANGNPQLRLTNVQQDPANVATTGRYAEFHDLQNGDLNISANDNTQINTITQILKERFVGINTITPGNTVEINSQYVSSVTPNGQPAIPPTLVPPTGWAGLRFSDLRSTSIPQVNPSSSVLSVDANGDIIFVQSSTGNYCLPVPAPNPLVGFDYEIPLNTFNYRFSGQAIPFDPSATIPNQNVVGIGYNCGANMPAKFSVLQNIGTVSLSTIAGAFLNNDISTTQVNRFVGVAGTANGLQVNGGNYNIGGYFNAFNAQPTNNIGVYGGAPAGSFAGYFAGNVLTSAAPIIVSDQQFKTNVATITNAKGILQKLKPHTYDMDVINYPQFNFETVKQYGFIAQEVEPVLPELVHQAASPPEKDDFGNIIHPSVQYKSLNYNALIPIAVQAINELGAQMDKSTLSDQTVKTNVQNLTGSLVKVKQMRGVTYEWNTTAQSTMNLDSLTHIGFIAQEINTIEPLLTFVDDSSLMHVNYDRVVPMLVESIKELDNTIAAKDSIIEYKDSILDYRLTVLEAALNACCSNHSMQSNGGSQTQSIAQTTVDLKDGQSIVLEQNVPNPFAEQTTINYFLPDNVVKAQVLFYNALGRLIQSTELSQKGKGQLNVFASDLSNGIYSYTLVVDGKIIETKKMVKQQ